MDLAQLHAEGHFSDSSTQKACRFQLEVFAVNRVGYSPPAPPLTVEVLFRDNHVFTPEEDDEIAMRGGEAHRGDRSIPLHGVLPVQNLRYVRKNDSKIKLDQDAIILLEDCMERGGITGTTYGPGKAGFMLAV